MQTLKLRGIAQEISRAGMGGCPLGGHGWGQVDDQQAMQAVRHAVEQGINFFDTADIYGFGHSEELLTTALGADRNRVVIATKFGVRRLPDNSIVKDISPEYLRQALEGSLRRLRLESIPLYYIHWPDGRTPVEEAVGELERQRSLGKIGAIGVSNFSADQLRSACSVAPISAAQVQYSLVDRQIAEMLSPVARELQVPLVTWGSLAQGLLTGKYDATTAFGSDDRRHRYENFSPAKLQQNLQLVERLKEVAHRQGKLPAQVALRWLLDTEGVGVVLFGAKNARQVSENGASADDWRLSPADYQLLEQSSSEMVASLAG